MARLRRERQGRVADLGVPGCRDLGAQRAGEQLGAQADAEGPPTSAGSGPDGTDLGTEEGVPVTVVGADRPAEDDEEVGCAHGVFVDLVHAGVQVAHGVAALDQERVDEAEVFEGKVPDGQGGLQHVGTRSFT